MRALGITLAIMFGGLIFLGFVGCETVVSTNNSLATQEQAVVAARSQVDNQLKRRADLIDNIVETVKGYATHEHDTLADVIAARNSGASKGGSFVSALKEAYPELKADKRFAQLQSELEGTENRLAVARKDHIRSIQVYNTHLKTFPASFLNGFLGYKPTEEYFIDDADKVKPKVKF